MKNLLLIFSLASAVSHGGDSFKWQAEIRERFHSNYAHPFGGDSSLRVRSYLSGAGFNSFTLETRLGMSSENSRVFLPGIRSRRDTLQTMVSSIGHAKADVVFKPVIFDDPGLGVANRSQNITLENPTVFFETYRQALRVYTTLARHRLVNEIVVGSGLDKYFTTEFGNQWIVMLKELKRQAGPDTNFSIEVSGDEGLENLQMWSESNPEQFADFQSLVKIVRVRALLVEDGQTGSAKWNVPALKNKLESRLSIANEIFPTQDVMLADIRLPACQHRTDSVDETICDRNAAFNKHYQELAGKAFFEALHAVGPQYLSRLIGVEFLVATTDLEPDNWAFDPRFPFYNGKMPHLFAEEFEKELPIPKREVEAGFRGPSSLKKKSLYLL